MIAIGSWAAFDWLELGGQNQLMAVLLSLTH
jgi:hypothetical protein